ncbi:MAG: M20/M25/M40 family metallo-hydrolase [Acidobacteria bacterium]|nr:M20/M25/M40 family metallo-hydrolase [Acidobacteriota bacterium]
MAISRPSSRSMIVLILLVGCTLAGLMMGGPPSTGVPATAPATEFSSVRAMEHVLQIAQRPHPVGSADHARVRDYVARTLEGMLLTVEHQKTTATRTRAGGASAASVENLLIRMKGTGSTGAVLLASHYDSVPAAPGAADDASGVAAMLETLRALKASPPLRNDVIFLFTDAEELGLLGAEAFVGEHPWAKDVRMAINLEARGTSGPSLMFETGEGNGAVVREWASAVPSPAGSSLTYEVYKRLPNDTDFSVFRRLGMPGLNFAFIGNWRAYHTPIDAPANLDSGSLQHQGAAALALMQRFGAMDLTGLKERDAVYFSVPVLRRVVRYSTAWVLPLAGLAIIAFVWVTVSAWRRLNTSIGGLLLGLIVWVVLGGLAGLWGYYFSRLIEGVHARWLSPGDLTMSWPYDLALVTSTITAGLFFYPLLRRILAAQTLALAGLFLCLLATCAASWIVPGGSYVLLWPLAGSLLAVTQLSSAIDRRATVGLVPTAVVCAMALPTTFIVWPLVAMLFQSLGLTPLSGAAVAVLTVLALFTLAPLIDLLTDRTRLWPASAALLMTLVSLGYGMKTTKFSDAQPRTINVIYALDADKHEAYWVARAPVVYSWLRQFLGDAPAPGRPAVLLPSGSSREGTPGYVHQRADLVDVGAPAATLIPGGETSERGRSVVLRVTPAAEGHALSIWLSGASVLEARVNGHDLGLGASPTQSRENTWTLDYGNAPAAGITLALMLKSTDRVSVSVLDRSMGWPAIAGQALTPRPADLVTIQSGDQTIIRRNFVF